MPSRRPRDLTAIRAELATMRAAGEISADIFNEAHEKVLSQMRAREQLRVIAESRNFEQVCKPYKGKWRPDSRYITIAIVIVVAIWAYQQNNRERTPQELAAAVIEQSTTDATRRADATAKTAKEAEDRRNGFHCLSGWDGSNRALVEAVKGGMREPGSFEHIKTAIGPVDGGKHTVGMEYRGRNGFGGMNVERAVGVLDTSCRLVEWTAI